MHSSDQGRKGKKFLYRVLAVVILLAVVFCAEYLAQRSFDEVRLSDYYNYDVKKLKKEHADVDMIFVGASQIYHGCNPDVISEELGIGEVLDCAPASGQCDGDYYLLRGLLRDFSPKYVVMEIPWHKFLKKQARSIERGSLLCADRMPLSDKLDYAFHCFPLEMLPNLSAMYRFGGQIWGTSQVINNYRAKKAVAEGNWVDESQRSYRKNGYCWFDTSSPQGSLGMVGLGLNYFQDDLVDEREHAYMKKMVDLCREKGVEVILVMLPSSLSEMYGVVNFQGAIDYATAFAKECDCPYINFSYLKNREELFPDTVFSDRVHLNGEGSVTFSTIFCDVLKMLQRGEDPGGMFYTSFDEMSKEVHRIVAAGASAVRNGDGTVSITGASLQNEEIIPEYRIVMVQNDEVTAELCPWQESTEFTLEEARIPDAQTAVMRLEARQKGKTEPDAYVKKIKIS